MNRFQCVADLQRRYGVKRLCSILGVSRSSFYYWRRTAADRAARQAADQCEKDGTVGLREPEPSREQRDVVAEAVDLCPSGAISFQFRPLSGGAS
ncbi:MULTISPECIES: ferredoxin [Streptomyces]|uniref:Transposase n=1 Tax=Streptomyces mutomycini TaxID=284036 RepID=A0ABW0B4F8_9ACTN|nr:MULTISPECIES: helix-turn-helix domain-containing protein [Streptomyces]